MEPLVIPTEELDHKDRETRNVRAWRVEQLRSLGLPYVLADSFADRLDWHALASRLGCMPKSLDAWASDSP